MDAASRRRRRLNDDNKYSPVRWRRLCLVCLTYQQTTLAIHPISQTTTNKPQHVVTFLLMSFVNSECFVGERKSRIEHTKGGNISFRSLCVTLFFRCCYVCFFDGDTQSLFCSHSLSTKFLLWIERNLFRNYSHNVAEKQQIGDTSTLLYCHMLS